MSNESCLKCGKIGHHRQSCTKKVPESEQYLISRLLKRIHKEEVNTESFYKPRFEMKVFSLDVLRNFLDVNTNHYANKLSEVEYLGLPGINLIETEQLKKLHHNINMDLLNFRKTDQELSNYCKERLKGTFISKEEKDDLIWRFDEFKLYRHEAYTMSNKLTMWSINAIASLHVFWGNQKRLQTWCDQQQHSNIMRHPIETIAEIQDNKRECVKAESTLGIVVRESRNLQNICKQEEVQKMQKIIRQLQTRLKSISQRWHNAEIELKTKTLEFEKSMVKIEMEKSKEALLVELSQKMTCTLCQEMEKEWALACGHMYCKKCLKGLESTRRTDGIPWTNEFTGQEHVFQVEILKECAFCKGSLVPKIKLYF